MPAFYPKRAHGVNAHTILVRVGHHLAFVRFERIGSNARLTPTGADW